MRGWAGLALAGLLAGCAAPVAEPDGVLAAFVLRGSAEQASVRVVTERSTCPVLTVDGRDIPLQPRAAASRMPARQASDPAVVLPLSCEALLPPAAHEARLGQRLLPVPRPVQRIVVVADSGCRLKGSEQAYQDCNDAEAWPFARIAAKAATLQPDLVLHLGDIHYRESPCPAGRAGCAGSPWGYGWAAWSADFFTPAAPLLAAAPWVFVRGNHESCARAGQGWFRYLDAGSWSEARSCNDPAQDLAADFSAPYAVRLGADTQLIVFDSARTGSQAIAPADAAHRFYSAALDEAERLATQAPHNFFLSHHPVLGFAPGKAGGSPLPGSAALQSLMQPRWPDRLLPPGVVAALHGHVHLFEALGFAGAHPATLVMGNAGSQPSGTLPARLPAGAEPAPGAQLSEFRSHGRYGFTSLERRAWGWEILSWSVEGERLARCELRGDRLRCDD